MLHTTIHGMGFLLIPKCAHKKPCTNVEFFEGWIACINKCCPLREDHNQMKVEYDSYLSLEGHFSYGDVPYDCGNLK
jgi:hypothetical protein